MLTALLATMLIQPPLVQETEPQRLLRLEGAYKSARAKSRRKPKDKALKSTYSVAASSYGEAVMNAQTLKDKSKKYVTALRLFREALKADPTNAKAKEFKGLIESIYQSMGKPIPQ